MDVFFNPARKTEITRGKLPHWHQDGVMYFVTFRLADSLPQQKLQELKEDREWWNLKHKNEFTETDWKKYNRLFNSRIEKWLNNGYGSCVLRKPENAEIVSGALQYFDGQRYILDHWVVMPNHVHVLVLLKKEYRLDKILHSWKSYSAKEINRNENRTSQLWMHESFDHIVRSDYSLEYYRKYIRENPIKAGIIAPAASWKK